MDAHAWDERYAAEPVMWGVAPNQTIVDAVERLPIGHAVDLACGGGRHAIWLASRGWQVDAVDFSAVAIEQARERAATDRINWIVGDALTWKPSAPVDLVLLAYLHVIGLADLIGRATTWLAPTGTLVYLGHALENLEHGVGGPPDPAILPTAQELAKGLSCAHLHRLEHVERATESGTAIDVLAVGSLWR